MRHVGLTILLISSVCSGQTSQRPVAPNEIRYLRFMLLNVVSLDHGPEAIKSFEDDTDNVVRENEIRTSAEVGILFRKERSAAFQGHRNIIEKNQIFGVTKETGIGIDVQGQTQSIKILANEIRETQAPSKRVGIRIGPDTETITLAGNRIEGFSEQVLDLRKKG